MAITFTERFKSPNSISEANNLRDDKWTKNYVVHGSAGENETAITTYLLNNLPADVRRFASAKFANLTRRCR